MALSNYLGRAWRSLRSVHGELDVATTAKGSETATMMDKHIGNPTIEGKRGVGFCDNTDCSEYTKGIFLMSPKYTTHFYCQQCRQYSNNIVMERWWKEGRGEVYKRVTVEYNYSGADRRYHEMAIVEDNDILVGAEIRFQSALIKTDKRALKVAEKILSNAALNPDVGAVKYSEITLDYDMPPDQWHRFMQALERKWLESPRHKLLTSSK